MPANKILTVTYEAFSCTLDGFDDPVAAMTEIAEYFCDLAAEDRLFGADPVAPDMGQLRGIAERRADHPVSVRHDDGGIMLSQRADVDESEDQSADAEGPPTTAQQEPAGDDAFAAAFRADALSDEAGSDLPSADAEDLTDGDEDTLAADLAAILSGGSADPFGPPADTGAAGEAASTEADAFRIRRARRADDARGGAASIVTPAASPEGFDAPAETRFDAGDDDAADEDEAAGTVLGLPGDDLSDGDRDILSAAPSVPDLERLFAATDSRLSGEATSRRIANISHLKAAVAARRADGPAGPAEDADTDAYRADLASSVRPRRAVRSTDTSLAERPARVLPLMLVSEQRVTAPAEAEADPATIVQPRRAPRQDDVETAEPDNLRNAATDPDAEPFERFAADRGATELPDILEAAALYTARLTGQDTFTRPALLHLAAEACDEMSREDGLRGFGQLLRDGRIRKVGPGTFALGDKGRGADLRTG